MQERGKGIRLMESEHRPLRIIETDTVMVHGGNVLLRFIALDGQEDWQYGFYLTPDRLPDLLRFLHVEDTGFSALKGLTVTCDVDTDTDLIPNLYDGNGVAFPGIRL
ncbi:hypothetical protein [Bifidobacterium felsineum]|uniref:hypothetical protein n=1 Tax=Bifidobacterium felsineum TaxID=2045440 RepID=UPI001BDD5C38|nr:hypothetical protein [Bifidobacterium felsineum]MBT1164637.1 hypothetical protein [Bifidobacterium felsineum]